MTAIGVRRLVRGGCTVLICVALLALTVLTGPPAAARAPFPAFIPIADTPSGVAVNKRGDVYVSVRQGTRGVIWKYTLDGMTKFVADIGEAVIYGLAVKSNGDLYAAMATGPDQGVYRVDPKGNVELLPGSDQIVFPNGLAFDDRGNLYVTESFSGSPAAYGPGGIWRIPAGGGEAELWVRDTLLTGVGILGKPPSPVGANGIGYFHGDLYVTNTDKGLVLKIAVTQDGSAGPVDLSKRLEEVEESPLAHSPFPIMPDGLAVDVYGNVYVTVLTRNAVVRIECGGRHAGEHCRSWIAGSGAVGSVRHAGQPGLRHGGWRAAEPLRHQPRIDGGVRAGAGVARAGAGQGRCGRTRPAAALMARPERPASHAGLSTCSSQYVAALRSAHLLQGVGQLEVRGVAGAARREPVAEGRHDPARRLVVADLRSAPYRDVSHARPNHDAFHHPVTLDARHLDEVHLPRVPACGQGAMEA